MFLLIYLYFFLKIDSEKRTHNFFNLIEVENIILLHTIIFIQKRLLANQQFRIFSIEIKRIQYLYFIRLFLFRKLLQVQKIASEQKT